MGYKGIIQVGMDESPNHNVNLPIFLVAVASRLPNDGEEAKNKQSVRARRAALVKSKECLPIIGYDFRYVLFSPEERAGKNYFHLWAVAGGALVRSYLNERLRMSVHIDGHFELDSDIIKEDREDGNLITKVTMHLKRGSFPLVPVICEAHLICGEIQADYLHHASLDRGEIPSTKHNDFYCYRLHENQRVYPSQDDLENKVKLVRK
jgi:hypothetical protein